MNGTIIPEQPENIMVDKEGYPRLIDLGFAKKIPFTLVVDGKPEVRNRFAVVAHPISEWLPRLSTLSGEAGIERGRWGGPRT